MAEHHTHYTDRHPSGPDDPGFVRIHDLGPIRATKTVIGRVAEKAWDHSIFSKAATAAFWQTLSLPPLLLGLLGSVGYIGGWFGPDTLNIIQSKIIAFSRDVFSADVVDQLIAPTVADVLQRGRPGIVSVGFLISLWAGSSAMSTFVDSIVEAHDQHEARHPLWQRIFALILYVAFLITAVFVLPIVALGPAMIARVLPEPWYIIGSQMLDFFYYPGVALLLLVGLTTLYKLALHRSLPWHRLLGGALLAGVFFIGASAALRLYLRWVAETGASYGALASTIAFLLFTFFLGFAVVLGAEFNATIQEFWPARATRIAQMREWLSAQATESPTIRVATGPIRVATDKMRDLVRGEPRDDAESPQDTTETTESPPPDPAPRRDPTQVSGG